MTVEDTTHRAEETTQLADEDITQRMKEIPPADRVLLLSHCLKISARCQARYDREVGLMCEGCEEECPINRIVKAAQERGFGGVCIAPGGKLAIRYVEKHHPKGIVAVACRSELQEGIEAVSHLSGNGTGWDEPIIITIPLLREGCVDTEVDVEAVLEAIKL